jgi:hypothetical protein
MNSFRTSRETHYVSTTEISRLMLFGGRIAVYTDNLMKHTNALKTNSVALSPQANYTDWATATCWRNLVQTFVDRGVSRGQRGGSPTLVNLSFLDQHKRTL